MRFFIALLLGLAAAPICAPALARGAAHRPALTIRPLHAKAAPAAPSASSLLRDGLDLAKRGRGAEALQVASRIGDPVAADIVRGEAYASGGASANAGELFAFAKRHPVWPQRTTILANAEGQLSMGEVYEPLLDLYTADSPPATPNGFAIWQATLRAHGRAREADAAVEAREAAPAADDAGESARWKDIHMQIRDQLSQKNYDQAYRLASAHGLAAPSANNGANAGDYATAQFLCGWLSLRYMHAPDRAMQHFQQLYDNVKTPVSRTRAAYWLGRTAEALGNPGAARSWYQEAAAMPTFFYGQLALAKLDKSPTLILPAEPAVPAAIAAKWNAGGLPRAVRLLAELGDEERATRFMKALLAGSDTRAEFALASQLARDLHRPYFEVQAAKAANQKGIVLGQAGFPKLDVEAAPTPYGSGVSEPALTLGIIRQESEFRADARSSAGAVGLMQLMPATAQIVARSAPGGYSESRLTSPAYNISLGRAYLGDRVEEFGGSYILAIAAYNAGKGRVKEWLEVYGDPRDPGVDPIDWIETIPIYETRNYVQRVLENTEVYRARLTSLDGGKGSMQKAPLRIVEDLTRR